VTAQDVVYRACRLRLTKGCWQQLKESPSVSRTGHANLQSISWRPCHRHTLAILGFQGNPGTGYRGEYATVEYATPVPPDAESGEPEGRPTPTRSRHGPSPTPYSYSLTIASCRAAAADGGNRRRLGFSVVRWPVCRPRPCLAWGDG
jgi:hypothetical protein